MKTLEEIHNKNNVLQCLFGRLLINNLTSKIRKPIQTMNLLKFCIKIRISPNKIKYGAQYYDE